MLKAELFRLVKSKTMWAVTVLVIAAIFVIGVYYADNTVSKGYLDSQISEYSSIEEIPEKIAEIEERLKDEENSKYENVGYERAILIYQYLYENKISYDELTAHYATAYDRWYYSDDAVSYVDLYMTDNCAYVICAAMILCAAVLVAGDFSGNMYKTVFGTNQSRVVILRGRFFAYLIYLAVLFAAAVVIISVTSVSYGLPFQHIICVVAGNVFVLPPVVYLVITFALWAVFLLEYAVAIFGISACFKNIFAALAFPAAYYGGIAALSGTDAGSGASAVFGKEIYALNGTFEKIFFGYYPWWCYLAAFAAKLLFAVLFLALGMLIYQKRQL